MKNALALILIIGATGTAAAGTRNGALVGIDTVNHLAYGSIADARASSDSYQSIGCSYSATTSYGSGLCSARNSAGTSVYCHTQDQALLNVIASIRDGYIYFTWDAATGNCTYVYSSNSSVWAPKY